MGQRSYIPQTGRFLQTDPIPEGSANNYDYTNQDPINRFDLDGTVSVPQNRCATAAGAKKCKGGGFLGIGNWVAKKAKRWVNRYIKENWEALKRDVDYAVNTAPGTVAGYLQEGFCYLFGRTKGIEYACAAYTGIDYTTSQARRIRRRTRHLVHRYG